MTEPMNLVYIMSDEHNKEMLGCYGHPVVKTPNLDALAKQGVRFTNAYCNSPICVPSRASMATGRYVHEIGAWDNAAPYIGTPSSWGHRLTEQGHCVTTIGKLHYRDDNDNTGFPDIRHSFHVLEGIGDIYSLIRDNMEPRPINRQKILEAGSGETSYIRFDRAVGEEAERFLKEEVQNIDQPWVLFVSLATPHFPLIVPEEYYNMYPIEDVVFPKQYSLAERPKHPVLEEYRRVWCIEDEFDDRSVREAVAAYYGLCTFMDEQVGRVLQAIEDAGINNKTRIIYTSDHGDTIGAHAVWFKSTMYEGSVGVPFIMKGPDLPQGRVIDTPISLIDSFPTIIESVGAQFAEEDEDLPGKSLYSVIEDEDEDRIVFSEYHAMGSVNAYYMIRDKAYKYIHYIDHSPQLFDLHEDPDELVNLADDSGYKHILNQYELKLRQIINPEKVDQLAKADQQRRIEEHGGKYKILKDGFKVPFSPVPKEFH